MHVLHYIPNFLVPFGGGDIFGRGLVGRLQKYHNIHQDIITNSPQEKKVEKREDGVTVISLTERQSGGYLVLCDLLGTLRNSQYDLIHIHGYGQYTADIVCLLKVFRVLKTPILMTTHGMAGLKLGYLSIRSPSLFRPVERVIRLSHLCYDFTLGWFEIKTFDKVIIMSDEEKTYLSKFLNTDQQKLKKIPVAINDLFLHRAIVPFRDRSYILYAGRLDPFKGLDTLLKAFGRLNPFGLKLKCIIVGNDAGMKDKLYSLTNQLNISKFVEIRDQVPQEILASLYSSALVTILPSLSEGFPLSLVESMAVGTPFIGTPVGAIPEVVNQSKAGLLTRINDPEYLAQTIYDIVLDEEKWHKFSANGVKFACDFTWDQITKRYYEVYSELIAGARR